MNVEGNKQLEQGIPTFFDRLSARPGVTKLSGTYESDLLLDSLVYFHYKSTVRYPRDRESWLSSKSKLHCQVHVNDVRSTLLQIRSYNRIVFL